MIDLDKLDELELVCVSHEYREFHIISMPICDACKHVVYDENGDITCLFRKKINLDELQSEGCINLKSKCKDFEVDKESCLYELLMEHVEEAKKKA